MTEGSSIAMEARFATHQESLDSDSGDHFSLWREVDPFPVVLHRMLGDMENEGTEHVISWNDDGMSFTIHKPKEFAATILTRYFRNQTRYKSFQRQLNLYRFHRISTAKERAAYAHKSFVRDSPHLCRFVRRTRKQPRIPEVTGTHPNPPIENFPFIPTMLPFELSLTHSATSGVKNNPSLYGKQHLKSPCPITCMNPCANLEVSSPPLLAPTKPLPCPTPKFPGEFNREPSENQMSILAWLASLRPVDAVASIDKAWDDLSMGSIDHDDWTTSSSLILANHDDSLSWACSSFDGEIFP